MTFKSYAAATAIALTCVSFGAAPAALADGHAKECKIIAKADRNRDGKLSRLEAVIAGKKAFKKINDDGDRTLEPDEAAKRHIGPRTFDKYNRIKRKGLDRIEWSRLVKHRFKVANTDGDRTIECDELVTHRGHKLLAVIWY